MGGGGGVLVIGVVDFGVKSVVERLADDEQLIPAIGAVVTESAR